MNSRHEWMLGATRWTGATPAGNWERFGYVGSYGGASLQACALVLIFAACVESQRPTCPYCRLWHHRDTPCETFALDSSQMQWPPEPDPSIKVPGIYRAIDPADKVPGIYSWTSPEPLTIVSASCTIKLDGEG